LEGKDEEGLKEAGLMVGVEEGLGKAEEDMKFVGTADGGGVKNEPSSKVSRKSLIVNQFATANGYIIERRT
jgi:hypothetical protein